MHGGACRGAGVYKDATVRQIEFPLIKAYMPTLGYALVGKSYKKAGIGDLPRGLFSIKGTGDNQGGF